MGGQTDHSFLFDDALGFAQSCLDHELIDGSTDHCSSKFQCFLHLGRNPSGNPSPFNRFGSHRSAPFKTDDHFIWCQ